MGNVVFLNGEWLRRESAKISVFDRGFMFGDAIYEVMAAYCGLIHEKDSHLDRLESSLDSVGMRLPFPRAKIERTLDESLQRNKVSNALIYLQVSRGVQFPRNHKPWTLNSETANSNETTNLAHCYRQCVENHRNSNNSNNSNKF